MKWWKFAKLYTHNGWISDAFVQTDDQGKILEISTDAAPNASEVETINAFAIPGFPNAHSHAFQYAMAGTSEHVPAGSKNDDFWSWREAMYRVALTISPEILEAVATQVYAEMLRNGYTSVAEFHYLHRDPKGNPYANKAEMGARLIAAAQKTGIAITLVPVLYQQADLCTPANARQLRFLSPTLEEYQKLVDASRTACHFYDRARIGVGVHSIRAVAPHIAVEYIQNLRDAIPIHLHIAEQLRDVEQCQTVLGKRPVEWLLEHLCLDERFNLVHATHIDANEISALAATKANVILCPSTEANLGDGFFPLRAFEEKGGAWTIGSDSHIGLSPLEELRWLDYGQRLLYKKRNILCTEPFSESGDIAFRQSYLTGQKAMGHFEPTIFAPGADFDCLLLDAQHPLLANSTDQYRLSTLIYACDSSAIQGVITGGKWRVRDGKHIHRQSIQEQYSSAVRQLQT